MTDGKWAKVGETVSTMSQTFQLGYAETKDMQVLAMPYKGEEFEMIVFLPRQNGNLPRFEGALNGQLIEGDHPFLFLIFDAISKTILFIGRVSDASVLKKEDPVCEARLERHRQKSEERENRWQQEAEEREERERPHRELAAKLFPKIQESGIVCPHCNVHTRNIKYTPGRTFMICRECGRSFTPDRINIQCEISDPAGPSCHHQDTRWPRRSEWPTNGDDRPPVLNPDPMRSFAGPV